MITRSMTDGWANIFPPHRHWRLWKPWCNYTELWRFGEDTPYRYVKRSWTRKQGKRFVSDLIEFFEGDDE